jgi:hypothetical protein
MEAGQNACPWVTGTSTGLASHIHEKLSLRFPEALAFISPAAVSPSGG